MERASSGRPGSPMRDHLWRGYDGRAMLPVFAAAAAASLVLLTGRWYLDDLSAFADRSGSLVLFGVDAVVWATVLAFWAYRTITYTYRLTDRALLIDRGFRWPPDTAVWLSDVADARAAAGPVGRRLGVGRVVVTTRTGRVVTLAGVRDPRGFAAAVRAAAKG